MSEICAFGTETSKDVIARKQYKCCECNRIISKGEKYWSFSACWPQLDGWATYRTCLRCKKIRELAESKYEEYYPEEYPGFGELYYWIRERR